MSKKIKGGMNQYFKPPLIPIPALDKDGYLPIGLHAATLAEVRARFGMPKELARLYRVACKAGIDRVILAGSFVTQHIKCMDLDGILFGADTANWELLLQHISSSKQSLDFLIATDVPMLRTLVDFFSHRLRGGRRGLIEIPIAGGGPVPIEIPIAGEVSVSGVLVNPATHEAVLDYQLKKLRTLAERAGSSAAHEAFVAQIKELEKKRDSVSPEAFYKQCLRMGLEMPASTGRGDVQINSIIGLFLQETRPFRIVDYGCGKGRLAYELATLDSKVLKRMEYIGVSADVTEVEATIQELGLRARCRHLELRRLGDTASLHNTADYLIMVNVLHEIPLHQVGSSLGEAISILRKPGLLVIHDLEHLVHGERNFVPWSGEDAQRLITHKQADVTVRRHASKAGIPFFTLAACIRADCLSSAELAKRALFIYEQKEMAFIKARYKIAGVPGEEREYAYLSVAIANIREQLAAAREHEGVS